MLPDFTGIGGSLLQAISSSTTVFDSSSDGEFLNGPHADVIHL